MSLEERIHQSVAHALDEARVRMEAEVRGIVQGAVATAAQEQHVAVTTAREAALDEAGARLHEALAQADSRAATSMASSIAAVRVSERELGMAGHARLLDAIRELDLAGSLTEVLDTLGRATARETGRVALLVLRGERVQSWHLSGFGELDAQPQKSIDLHLGEAGMVGEAATTLRPVTTNASEQSGAAPAFVGLLSDRVGLAVPLTLAGRAVAVVYADASASGDHERPVPSPWPEVIEILARHAARCLEALTIQKTGASGSNRSASATVPRSSDATVGTSATSSAPGDLASSISASRET